MFLHICIVTPDLLGPIRNGGIGTACTYLARELSSAGHHVTLLFSLSDTDETEQAPWIEEYTRLGINVTIAEVWAASHHIPHVFPEHPSVRMAHFVYNWLKKHRFDIILFMEWQGHGFYALHAKQCGLYFQDTAMIVQTHSPSLWHAINNADLSGHPLQALTWFMERQSVAMADAVISPSRYMLQWLKEHHFCLPVLQKVQPNLLEVDPALCRQKGKTSIRELVFFGRLEYRKGLVEFCDALDCLVQDGHMPHEVSFLGKCAWVGAKHAALYIARRAEKWPFPIRILPGYGHQQALEYLSGEERLAVIPSVADNSPYTVYECAAYRIPFVARDVGGVKELLSPDDWKSCLCNDNPRSLAGKLKDILEHGVTCPKLAFDLKHNQHEWRTLLPDLLHTIRAERVPYPSDKNVPLISVCLTHYQRPYFLKQALDALRNQNYPRFEVILADDGSTDKKSKRFLHELQLDFHRRGWKLLRLPNGYLGKARNAAVREAKGDYVLFLDDDNVPRPSMIRTLTQAALCSGADLVTCFLDVFTGNNAPVSSTKIQERFLPLGDIVSWSAVTNIIGDASSLVRRSFFEKMGGFSEDYGLGHEDFELYLRMVLHGATVVVVPESLLWYRRRTHSMLADTNAAANRMRSLRPFLECLPANYAELAALTHLALVGNKSREERCAAAPEKLSPEEKEHFAEADPASLPTLSLVADSLIASGQSELAVQMMESLRNVDAGETAVIRLRAKACGIARKDPAALQNVLNEFEAGDHDEAVRAAFYATLLETSTSLPISLQSHELFAEIFRRLCSCSTLDNHACLIMTRYLFQNGRIDEARIWMERALRFAGKDYLKRRPDVAEAIKKGMFTCALQHYALHGKQDRTPWPEKYRFIRLLQDCPKLLTSSEISTFTAAPYAVSAFLKK